MLTEVITLNYRNQIVTGNALDILRQAPDKKFQCCVTSPPYFGLRDYGTATWINGDPSCDHLQKVGGINASTLGTESGGHAISAEAKLKSTTRSFVPYRDVCAKCGAKRVDVQIGLEQTPKEYVENLVGVFNEVKRTLRDDGTLWIVVGDSYANTPAGNKDSTFSAKQASNAGSSIRRSRSTVCGGLKQKDLIGIPWMLAFALRDAGWYLRRDNIWDKSGCCMPESVEDRCTTAHEYVFQLSKCDDYYYDKQAIAEPSDNAGKVVRLGDKSFAKGQAKGAGVNPSGNGLAEEYVVNAMRNRRSVWHINTTPCSWEYCHNCHTLYEGPQRKTIIKHKDADGKTILECPKCHATQAWVNHFAAYPRELVEVCIKAGSRQNLESPDIVLDPFVGSGTTAIVAKSLCRDYFGIDLNEKYANVSQARVNRVIAQYRMF